MPQSRSRSRGAQAKPTGSSHARGLPEGSSNIPGIHSPYARLDSGDPLRRKQTILSLIDMLSELSNNDSAFEAGAFHSP